MRLSILVLLFSCCAFIGSAQITITSATFPVAGDTLRTVIDGLPSNIVVNPAGGAIGANWDFSSLQGVLNQSVYQPASAGAGAASFPNADLVTISGVTGENYYNVVDGSFQFIGYQGPDPAGLGIDLAVNINPSLQERIAPLDFGDTYTDEGAVLLPVSADDLPGALVDSFAITPDSLRLRLSIDRTAFVEGWGTMTIPGGTYDVLREKRIEESEARLDIKVGIGPFSEWVDVTDIIGLEFLGKDTTTTYRFYSEDSKELIAIATVDNENNDLVRLVEYKYNDVTTNIRYVNNGKPDLLAYPNPAIEDIRLEFMNLPAGTYTVKILNILGIEVWEENYYVQGDLMAEVDISKLRKGTYLYSLVNQNGKTISTKRLIVMRP